MQWPALKKVSAKSTIISPDITMVRGMFSRGSLFLTDGTRTCLVVRETGDKEQLG